MKKLKEIFLILLIGILIIIACNIFYSKIIKKEKIVSIFGKTIFVVETGSMEPTIHMGELIVVSEEKNYNQGDIVTIADDDNYIYTHRIVEKDGEEIITKGDGNNLNDEKINQKYIVGKVVLHSKILGFFVIYLLKPFIMIDIFIIVMKLVFDFWKEEFDEENIRD